MKKILVADDSVTIQKVIALTFADEPFDVQSVGTGAEALEMMNSWKPDILLADVIMPQMNGYELCRAVKDQQETSSIPVLLLAGTFEAFDEEEAKAVGADGYITKPFESGELIEKVNMLVVKGPAEGFPQEPLVEPSTEPAAPPAGEPSSVEHPPEEILEMEPPAMESLDVEPFQPEPPGAEPPQEEPLQAEPPKMEPFQVEEPEAPSAGALEPEQITRTVPEPAPSAGAVKSGEPDIWDILSDSDSSGTAPDSGITGAAVPGMGPIEDQGVIDVGSFDVGLDRPEQPPAPPESKAEPDSGMPEPAGQGPVMEEPEEPQVAGEAVAPFTVPPEQVSTEKSRVEDREKDFFGFETEGPEAAGEDAFPADAVEEITFEMEEPAAAPDEAKQEASFIVPEPVESEIPVTGETLSPEALAPEPQPTEESPLPLEKPLLEEQSPEEFAVSLQEQIAEPEEGEAGKPAQTYPSDFVPTPEPPAELSIPDEEPVEKVPETPVMEPVPEALTAEPETGAEEAPVGDSLAGQPEETVPVDMSQELTEAELRKIVEAKVEKIVWEVVPEMAEVLIRETIEKIKGKP